MAGTGKKLNAKSKAFDKLSLKKQAGWAGIKQAGISSKIRVRKNFTAAKAKVGSIPGWIKNRPAAIKKWRSEDKKKKKYRSFRLQKRIKPEPRYIPSARQLLADSFKFLWKHKKIFFGIFLIHILLYFLLVRSPVTTDISTIQDSVGSLLGEQDEQSIRGTFTTLGTVIGVSSTSQTNTLAITVLMSFMSFVYIWSARQLHAGQAILVRDAYYQSLTPVVPSLIILIIISLQLIPFALVSFVYATARAGGLFANGYEDLSIFVITALIALLCFYWITSTIIALYIVTLPGMYPIQALKGAKKLVEFRRFIVFKRILVLPVLLGSVYISLLFIALKLFPEQVFIAAEVSQLLFLPVIHIYLYKLYRALI